jgi:HlyD family secretion protein
MNERARLLHSLTIERADTKAPPARRRLWPAVGATAFAVIVIALGLAWYLAPQLAKVGPIEQAAAVAPAPGPPPVAGGDAARSGGLVASGYVVARRKATVASEITGKVVEVLVDEGNVVREGDLLARLDSTLTESDLNLAKSRAVASEAAAGAIAADLRDTERILARTQALAQKNFATEADLTKADARVAVLRAQLAQAQAQVQTARLDAKRSGEVLEQHRIRAPFAGVVVERSAQPGEMISPISAGGGYTRTGICTIVDMDSIEVEVDVNEAFIGRVRAGGAVTAVLDAYPEWTIPASVIAIVPTANREKATVKVRIGFKQKDPRILPDMGIKVTFLDEADGSTSSIETSSAH